MGLSVYLSVCPNPLREAIIRKKILFYEKVSQTGGGSSRFHTFIFSGNSQEVPLQEVLLEAEVFVIRFLQ